MIDLVLWASTRDDLKNFAASVSLLTITGEGENDFDLGEGLQYHWWAGTGKLQTGPETTADGVFALIRFSGAFFEADRIDSAGAAEDDTIQDVWEQSKIAAYVKANGVEGLFEGAVPYFELGGCRVFTYARMREHLVSNGLPYHSFL